MRCARGRVILCKPEALAGSVKRNDSAFLRDLLRDPPPPPPRPAGAPTSHISPFAHFPSIGSVAACGLQHSFISFTAPATSTACLAQMQELHWLAQSAAMNIQANTIIGREQPEALAVLYSLHLIQKASSRSLQMTVNHKHSTACLIELMMLLWFLYLFRSNMVLSILWLLSAWQGCKHLNEHSHD